jgi:hypothetical protein
MVDDYEGKEIQSRLEKWRESTMEHAERPEWFWSRQHARVMSQINSQPSAGIPKLAWASLAATIAVAVSLIVPSHPEKQIQPPATVHSAAAQISDHDLMLAVERTLNAGTPSSLEPASLLADEMNQALETQDQSRKAKESKYEN